jgi:DUF1680 family protein
MRVTGDQIRRPRPAQCTGDARYGDWIEALALNGIGVSIPMTLDGRVFYYSDYNLGGGHKEDFDASRAWSCCSGTRPQAVADYADLVYFHDRDNLYVNLFTPARPSLHYFSEGL